ncbi:MAG: hypothetical protein V3R99_00215, partial [Thermoguttaceae bacterium]
LEAAIAEAIPSDASLSLVDGNRVEIEVTTLTDGSAVASQLEAIGMDVTGTSQRGVSGTIPYSALENLAALADVQSARPAHASAGAAADSENEQPGGGASRPVDVVLGEELSDLLGRYKNARKAFDPQPWFFNVSDGRVAVEVITLGGASSYVDELESAGMEDAAAVAALAGGWISIDALDDLAALPGVLAVRPAGGTTNVDSQVDPWMDPPEQRSLLSAGSMDDPIDIGVVDYVQLSDQDRVDGGLNYRFEASRDGILAASASDPRIPSMMVPRPPAPPPPKFSLYEYDDSGQLVELVNQDGALRYDQAHAGQTYLLHIEEIPFPGIVVSIANQVSVDLDTGELEAFGSSGEDTLEFFGGEAQTWRGEFPSNNTLILNGFTYTFDAEEVRSILIDSHMENVTLHGNDGDDTLTDTDVAVGMAGWNTIWITEIRFEGDWGRVEMNSTRDLVTVIGHGGYDTASLFNSWRSDHFIGSPDASTMKSASFEHTAVGFDEVSALRPHAESSTIELHDSPADDHLLVGPEGVTLSGDGYSIQVHPSGVGQTTPATVHVVSSGGNDTAEFHDSPGNDLFVATPTYASLSGDGYEIQVEHFATVKAYATAGGVDVARLYDSAGDDLFVGKPDFGGLSGEGFQNEAHGFDGVHAYATAGGIDLAKLFDSAADDIFYGDPNEASLYRPGEFYNRAKFFEGVHAYATAGGYDTAYLFESAGDDRFVATPESSALFGTGFYNRAKHFEAVFAEAGTDGDDEASLQGDESIRFLAAWADYAQLASGRLGDGPMERGYRATGFDRVKAIADPDGWGLYELLYPGDDHPGEREFLLEYEGEWLPDD